MIIPGSTPTHTFELPWDTALVKACRVFYTPAGSEEILIQKDTDALVLKDDTVSVDLTQEETLRFKDLEAVDIQLQILSVNDKSFLSTVKSLGVLPSKATEVLSGE